MIIHYSNKNEGDQFPGWLRLKVQDPIHYIQPQREAHLYLVVQTHQPFLVGMPTQPESGKRCWIYNVKYKLTVPYWSNNNWQSKFGIIILELSNQNLEKVSLVTPRAMNQHLSCFIYEIKILIKSSLKFLILCIESWIQENEIK